MSRKLGQVVILSVEPDGNIKVVINDADISYTVRLKKPLHFTIGDEVTFEYRLFGNHVSGEYEITQVIKA